ncbi:MAG: hypothetical protein ABJH68_13445 [Ilumatobacter sp.]|uniref:hypothetical protein n=1 Tax=Ilumatobacter sp. TaxID=1967498 RepID=UPI003298EEEF
MRVGDQGVISVISFYLYGLIGLCLLIVVSPLIVFATPLLVVLGPVGIVWWRGRQSTSRIGAPARWWLVVVTLLVPAMPVVPAVSYLVAAEDGTPPESFWLIVIGILLLPMTLAAVTYALRCGGPSKLDAAAASE